MNSKVVLFFLFFRHSVSVQSKVFSRHYLNMHSKLYWRLYLAIHSKPVFETLKTEPFRSCNISVINNNNYNVHLSCDHQSARMIHINLNTIFYTCRALEHCQPFVTFGLQGWGEVEGGGSDLGGGGGGVTSWYRWHKLYIDCVYLTFCHCIMQHCF